MTISAPTEKGEPMYKCCWNCENGFAISAKTREEMELINASKRICCADYPVSNRLENPFKRRYCKQFMPDFCKQQGDFIDKVDAEKLNAMTPYELVEYWRERRTDNG